MEKTEKPADGGTGQTAATQIAAAQHAAGPALRIHLASDLLDQLHDLVFFTDLKGVISGCNRAIIRYGYTPEGLVGKNLAELLHEDGDALAKGMISAAAKNGRFQGQVRGQSRSGQAFCLELCLTRVCNAESAPIGMIGISIDVTDASSEKTKPNRTNFIPASVPASAPAPVAQTTSPRRIIDGTEFVIASPVMHKFMGMVERVAGHTETVLITGETGTGKELVARTIHQASVRARNPLIDINCAALPEHLVESELFGYEKGAFSGADSSKPGLFELADRSTIFLDEIGELEPQIQVKLLRILDGAPFYRLGGHRKITVNVRVVAATNLDLELAVKEGRFRKDLFHRLSQFQLRVPPLRERPEDITALAQHFLLLKAPGKSFSSDALAALQTHPWSGNIRELRNLVAKLALSAPEDRITAAQVMSELGHEPEATPDVRNALPQGNLENMEEQMIIRALEKTGGHRSQAAEQLGISRRTLSRKLREYGIDVASGAAATALGKISAEQQKFFRAKVNVPVTLRNANGKEVQAQAINLSTGGMGLDQVTDPGSFAGLLDVHFLLPDTDIEIQVKGRLMWADAGGRAGLRFVVIEPALFERLQQWSNQKMKDEGWETAS